MAEDQEHQAGIPSPEKEAEAEQIVRDNIGWMLSLSTRLLQDSTLAQDAVQDAFLSAFQSMQKFEGRSSLKTWLHRITVNASLTKLRQLKRLNEHAIEELLPEFDHNNCRIEPAWTYLANTAEVLERDDFTETVRAKLYELPEEYRIVFQLRDIEGYSTREVSELLEISESNAKVRLHRARAALKKLLEPILRGDER